MCKKRRYKSAKAAKIGSRGVSNRIRPYFCAECRAYHVADSDKEMAGSGFRSQLRPGKRHL